MNKKLTSIISIILCVALITTNVHAFPVQDSEYSVTTTPVAEAESLSSAESIVWKSTEPDKYFGYSPAICVVDRAASVGGKRIVVTYDVSADRGEIVYSDDAGASFTRATLPRVENSSDPDNKFIFARPFQAGGELYIVARRVEGTSQEPGASDGNLIMFKATDDEKAGTTWSAGTTIATGVWHSAPTEIVTIKEDGVSYVYMTWNMQDMGVASPIIMKAPVDADLTDSANWIYSDATVNNENAGDRLQGFNWSEGNIVRITDTSSVLYDEDAVCHIYLRSSGGAADYANVIKVVKDEEGNMVSELVTTPSGKTLLYMQLPGGQSKFFITYDETSKLYWMVSNVSADSLKENACNELGLFYSSNAMDWDFAGYVARTENLNQTRSYPSMVINGDDLLVVSRAGDENAQSANNNNMIMFHRISGFRNLATKTSIASGAGTSLKASNGTAYYSSNILKDDSIADINTYITKLDTTIVTCSVSDEKQTTSKVLVKNTDDFYAETMETSYKLGEPFEAKDYLYVLGVADQSLVVFQSKDEGMTWSGPYVIDKTRHWNEAPTSAIVNDDSVMLALSQISKATYWKMRGYNGANACTYDENSKLWTMSGYGAVGYTETFDLAEGDSIAFDIEPKTLIANDPMRNAFGLAFLDAPTFWGNEADYGTGFVVNVRTNSDYTADNTLQFYTSYLDSNGAKPNTPKIEDGSERIGKKAVVSHPSDKSVEVRFTKRTQTIDSVQYAWTISVTYLDSNNTKVTLTKNIPASELPADKFASGLYLAAGARNNQNIEYKISNVRVGSNSWKAYTTNNGYKGTVTEANGVVTMDNRAAAYCEDKIPVQEGTKISLNVQIPRISGTSLIQYALGLSTVENSFYTQDNQAVTIAAELVSLKDSEILTAGVGYRIKAADRVALGNKQVTNTRTDISNATYLVTFEKLANGNQVYSWKVTAKDMVSGKEYVKEIPTSAVGHDVYADGAYVVAGAMYAQTEHQLKVFNVTVTQPDEFAGAATASNARNRIAPVIIKASLSDDLTKGDSWTYATGTSFVEKIGNAYSNVRVNYFGLPFSKVNARNIGWSDLKLFEVHNGEEGIYGYMTLENVGYNYAAFVKVSNDKMEFLTPPAMTKIAKEEEMVFAKLPGGNNSFEILYDALFDRYWLVTTVNTDIALYYSNNAYDWIYVGAVAEGLSGDARVSADINDDDLFITATGANGVVSYTVSAFRDLVRTDRWSLIRGYNEEVGTGTMTNQENVVTLSGYGGAVCDTKILPQDDAEFCFELKPTVLPQNSWFSVGLIDTKGSFFGDTTSDTGNGFQITIKPWSDENHGAQVLYNYVVDGVSINPVEGETTESPEGEIIPVYPFVGGAQIPDRIVGSDMQFKFVKLSNGNWCVYITVEINGVSYERCQEIPTDAIKTDLFKSGAYFIAGGSNGRSSTCEISKMKIRQPVNGDVNDDGEINALDIVATDFRYRERVQEENVYTPYEKHIYDIDKDGDCDVNDVNMLRLWVLEHNTTTQAVSKPDATKGKVRLERVHYKVNGQDMTDVTINTNFLCGGLEGLFLYDDSKLSYQSMACRTSEVNSIKRNDENRSVRIDGKGTMLTALGKVKYGTKGDIITLTFKGIWKEDFNMDKDVFANVDGTEHMDVSFYDVMLGDAHKDYEIDARDLVSMKKQESNVCTEDGLYMNSDCDRDDVVTKKDAKLLRDYLCEIIKRF